MNAAHLNTDIFRSLGVIAEDETMLDRVAKYLRRVAKQMTESSTEKENELQVITPALRRRIDAARKEYAEGKTITCRTPQEMQQFFDSL